MRRRGIGVAAALALMLAAAPAGVAGPEPDVLGLWLTSKKKLLVELYPCKDEICGRIVWLANQRDKSTGRLKRDKKNPDPALRGRTRCGIEAMWGLEPRGGGAWKNGTFYNPRDGSTYGLNIELQADGTLQTRGYVGIPLFGMNETWTRPGPEFQPGCETED